MAMKDPQSASNYEDRTTAAVKSSVNSEVSLSSSGALFRGYY